MMAAPDCKMETCESLKRIVTMLHFYQSTISNDDEKNGDLLLDYVQNQYKELLTDYQHIISNHLNKSKKENDDNYYIINCKCKKYIQCDLSNCNNYQRNNRDRCKEQIIENYDSLLTIYTDIIDTIHCYFIHSFDTGFRIKSHALKIKEELKETPTMSYETMTDKQFDDILILYLRSNNNIPPKDPAQILKFVNVELKQNYKYKACKTAFNRWKSVRNCAIPQLMNNSIKNDMDNDTQSNDLEMQYLIKEIKSKRKQLEIMRGFERIEKNKFVIDVTKDEKDEKHPADYDDNDAFTYSFGQKFYYDG
eukprot:195453_1